MGTYVFTDQDWGSDPCLSAVSAFSSDLMEIVEIPLGRFFHPRSGKVKRYQNKVRLLWPPALAYQN